MSEGRASPLFATDKGDRAPAAVSFWQSRDLPTLDQIESAFDSSYGRQWLV